MERSQQERLKWNRYRGCRGGKKKKEESVAIEEGIRMEWIPRLKGPVKSTGGRHQEKERSPERGGGGGRAEKKAVRLDTYRQRFESDHFPHGFAFLFTFIGTVLL